MMTWRKSALRPLLSVSVPWSMTCSSRLNTSGMRLLDLVEQQHAVRMLGDGLGEQAALVEADVARRRADQARHRVPLHVLGHVEAQELDAHARCASCRVTSVLPTPVGPANRKEPTGLRWSPRPERAILIAAASASIALSWPKITSFRLRSRLLQHVAVGGRHALRRECAPCARRRPRCGATSTTGLALADRLQAQARAGLVDHVDRLVGQVPLVDVPRRELRGRAQRLVRVADAVMLLEARLRPMRISTVSATDGSATSIFWKRRASAWSFSKMPRYSW